MHTPICDRLGIEFPMFAFSHCRDVVAAVSQAGGFGVLGALGFSVEEFELELQWIDDRVDAAAWSSVGIRPSNPVAALLTRGAVTLPMRYVCGDDPKLNCRRWDGGTVLRGGRSALGVKLPECVRDTPAARRWIRGARV